MYELKKNGLFFKFLTEFNFDLKCDLKHGRATVCDLVWGVLRAILQWSFALGIGGVAVGAVLSMVCAQLMVVIDLLGGTLPRELWGTGWGTIQITATTAIVIEGIIACVWVYDTCRTRISSRTVKPPSFIKCWYEGVKNKYCVRVKLK